MYQRKAGSIAGSPSAEDKMEGLLLEPMDSEIRDLEGSKEFEMCYTEWAEQLHEAAEELNWRV